MNRSKGRREFRMPTARPREVLPIGIQAWALSRRRIRAPARVISLSVMTVNIAINLMRRVLGNSDERSGKTEDLNREPRMNGRFKPCSRRIC